MPAPTSGFCWWSAAMTSARNPCADGLKSSTACFAAKTVVGPELRYCPDRSVSTPMRSDRVGQARARCASPRAAVPPAKAERLDRCISGPHKRATTQPGGSPVRHARILIETAVPSGGPEARSNRRGDQARLGSRGRTPASADRMAAAVALHRDLRHPARDGHATRWTGGRVKPKLVPGRRSALPQQQGCAVQRHGARAKGPIKNWEDNVHGRPYCFRGTRRRAYRSSASDARAMAARRPGRNHLGLHHLRH